MPNKIRKKEEKKRLRHTTQNWTGQKREQKGWYDLWKERKKLPAFLLCEIIVFHMNAYCLHEQWDDNTEWKEE